jgi:hypothetical protein
LHRAPDGDRGRGYPFGPVAPEGPPTLDPVTMDDEALGEVVDAFIAPTPRPAPVSRRL